MGWILPGEVDLPQLARCLEERGWRPVRIGQEMGYEKTVGPWVWIARLHPRPTFISWIPDDAAAGRHAEGVRRLREEVEAIAQALHLELLHSIHLDLEPDAHA